MDLLVLAIPIFLGLTAAEAIIVGRRPGARYRIGDLVSGLGCGTLDQVVNLFVAGAFLAVYAWVEGHWALANLDSRSVGVWVACVLCHDLAYYLFHRASHRVNALWAAHAVHHQSEDYTFAVSLRQGTIATWSSFGFYLPLAFVGFPLAMFITVHSVYQVYQFFVHTRLIPALGPLEWVLASPVLHRVHHGRDTDFLDMNYGGFFIVWDKLLGTFTPYTREPDYGVTAGIWSWSPYWANLHPYADLLRRSRRAPTLRQAVALWLRPPEWTAPWDAHERPNPGYEPAVPRWTAVYALAQIAAMVAGALAVVWPGLALSAAPRLALATYVLVTLGSVPALWDRRPWANGLEAARLAGTAAGAVALTVAGLLGGGMAAAIVAGCGLSAIALGWGPGPRDALVRAPIR